MAGKQTARYPIRAASRLTGLGVDTLRAWERRYGVVTPARDRRGRLYSTGDIRRLRLLRDAVTRGHAIGRAAGLSDAELERLVDDPPADMLPRGARQPPLVAATIESLALRQALERFDARAIEVALGRAATMLPPFELLRELVMPLLVEIGDAWCSGRATVAQEHLVSSIVQNVLGTLLRMYTPSLPAARLLLATPAGERHEIGVLGAAVIAASRGFDAVYLGAEVPADDLVGGADAAEADVLVLGVTGAAAMDVVERETALVAGRLAKDVELWVGGRAAAAIATRLAPRARVVRDYAELAALLKGLQ